MSEAGATSNMLLHACDFYLVVSVADLVAFDEHEWSDDVSTHPALQQALALLALEVDIVALYQACLALQPPAFGDVHVYRRAPDATSSLCAIDLYHMLTDAQDLVRLFVQCERARAPQVAAALFALFQAASCKITFEQSHHSARGRAMVDPACYPNTVQDSGYHQQMHVHYTGNAVP